MNILANVTSSLMDDYNEIIDYLSRNINGDTYFNTTLFSDIVDKDVNIDDYDLIVNFLNDDEDVLDAYFTLYKEALSKNRLNSFMLYLKHRESYANERVYYARKDANRGRLHRYLDYISTDEVVFDLMLYGALYYDADINIYNGMLRLKNYDVLDLGAVRFIANNPLLNKMYKKILVAKEEESNLIENATIEDNELLLKLERTRKYLDSAYCDFDRFLIYAVGLYKEIIYSFRNENIAILDYLFTKEYFEIGHFTSIASCFNRKPYEDMANDKNISFENFMSILKMTVFSMAFAENNQFVIEILNKVFAIGKEVELKAGRDNFFYFHAEEFYTKIGGYDSELSRYKRYVDLIEEGLLEPNAKNVYKAYRILAKNSYDKGMLGGAISYELKALKYAKRDIDIVNSCTSLAERYKLLADKDEESKYILLASKYVSIIDNGYHDDYSYAAIDIMSAYPTFDTKEHWKNTVIDKALSCKYLNNESYYFLYLKKMFDESNGLSDDDRIDGLTKITNEMVDYFYLKPTTMYLGIYNSLLVLAKLYEKKNMGKMANECYTNAYKYLTILENIDEDIDEQIAYVQYKIGDFAVDMDSNKSYRQLAKADKRIYQYILKTKKYIDFYDDLLIAINKRYFEDGRVRTGTLVIKNNLNKLVNCCQLCDEYFREIASYCERMANLFEAYKLKSETAEFRKLAQSYKEICIEKDVAISED